VPRPVDSEALVDEVSGLFLDTMPPPGVLPYRHPVRTSRPAMRQLR